MTERIDPNGPFSDVVDAKASARRLRASRHRSQGQTGSEDLEYTPFSLEKVLDKRPSQEAPVQRHVSRLPHLELAEKYGPGQWMEMLEWIMKTSEAEAVFLLDRSGLVIVSLGDLPMDQVECTGSLLMLALEQAERMIFRQDRRPSIDIRFGDRTLTGLRLEVAGVGAFTLGVVGVLSEEIEEALRLSLQESPSMGKPTLIKG